MLRSCFVSIPFGIKPDAEGRPFDFDHLYYEVIRPAAQDAEVEARRLDELATGAIWHKQLFAALASSDILIADVTAANPNVYYELGVRHALKRGRTILISGGGRLPGDLSYARVLFYRSDDMQLTDAAAAEFRKRLTAAIREGLSDTVNDSPVYEFFPDLEVTLPSEMEIEPRPRRSRRLKPQREFVQSAVESPARAKRELREAEPEVRAAAESNPAEYVALLRRYRDLSDWNSVIALADDAPPSIARLSEVRQLLALALNRRRRPGDSPRAIDIMQQHIAETGGDSESFGILGRIYKDLYDEAKARGADTEATEYLDSALRFYRDGFEKNPLDFYPGINVVMLLLRKGGAAAEAELAEFLPRVRAAVDSKIVGDRPDFWDLATDLQLAVVAGDWDRAAASAERAMKQSPPSWMVQSTLRDLRGLRESLPSEHRDHVDRIIELLQPDGVLG